VFARLESCDGVDFACLIEKSKLQLPSRSRYLGTERGFANDRSTANQSSVTAVLDFRSRS
jgi:hypothetical protein